MGKNTVIVKIEIDQEHVEKFTNLIDKFNKDLQEFNKEYSKWNELINSGLDKPIKFVDDRFGNPNAAYDFNGVDDYIDAKLK